MKIYTRTGDTGETSLWGGERVAKNHARIECYGTVDELNSQLGVVRATAPDAAFDQTLARIQSELFEIGAQLAAPGRSQFHGVTVAAIEQLEREIDALDGPLEPLRNFVLPGGTLAASLLHVARTVCRRAERLVVALDDHGSDMQSTIAYLNRLSDYLFVAARAANAAAGVADVPWSGRQGT